MTEPKPGAGTVYEGRLAGSQCVAVHVDHDHISRVEQIPSDNSLPELLPILVDLQTNGALGVSFGILREDGREALHKVVCHQRRHGVGRCLATWCTHSSEIRERTARLHGQWLAEDDDLALMLTGIFHEGVFISPHDGWRGIHPRQWIRPPDWEAFRTLDDLTGNRIRMVNVAPEEAGALDFIERAVDAGKLVTLGHCCPDADTVREATARGASMVTHFGNGAAPMIHRFKNPYWSFLNDPALRLGLIGDGFHLPSDLVGAALKCKGVDNCHFVSDAAVASGLPPGRYENTEEGSLVIESNGHLHEADSELLAGAWFQLDRSVELLVAQMGMSLREAWRLCSEVPASVIGVPLPSIARGQEASFVLARWDDGLIIEQAVHGGKAYLDKPINPLGV